VAYRVVACWPTNQTTPTFYDEFALGDASQTNFHDGHRAAKDGNKFIISERRATGANEINVYTFSREITDHVSLRIELAADNTVENDLFSYTDVALIGPCRLLFLAFAQAGIPAHGNQLKFKQRNLTSWPVFTPSQIVYDAGSLHGPLSAVGGTMFGGDIVSNGRYEFMVGAQPVVNPVQFCSTQALFYWRMTIPAVCPSAAMKEIIGKPAAIVILPDPRVLCKKAVQLRCITRCGKTFRFQPNKVVTYGLKTY
jgi:hypothetical protein